MPRSHCKNINNMKDQVSIFSSKPTCPIEIFSKQNYLDEHQDSGFRRAIINSIKEIKKFKEETHLIQPNVIEKRRKLKENKCLSDDQENKEMKTIWHLRRKFNKEMKTQTRTQIETDRIQKPINSTRNANKILASRMYQAGARILELEAKVQYLEQISKEYQQFN